MKRGMLCVMILALLMNVCGCFWLGPTQYHVPREGVWCCADLQITFTYEKDILEENNYIVIDGEKIRTAVSNDPGSIYFSVWGQDFEHEDTLGICLFDGKSVELTDKKFVVKEEETGKEYIFNKVDP